MKFWENKRVLVTGHTGFKGAWLSEMLISRGANVYGLALEPVSANSLFDNLKLAQRSDHAIIDLRDPLAVKERISHVDPQMVFHLGAQALVTHSYNEPLETWSTNVMGTIHLLQALREIKRVIPTVIVTTDKVYDNKEWTHCYRESDRLGGVDPYSSSKAAVELSVNSWRKSYPELCLATARAGNVIGGGDWSDNRIIPDLVRAFSSNTVLHIRNPHSTRPFQHVLEPLSGYLELAERLATMDDRYQSAYNFGPEPRDILSVIKVVENISTFWEGKWTVTQSENAKHEAGRLALSIEHARSELGWYPKWDIQRALEETIGWYRLVEAGSDAIDVTQQQIAAYENENDIQ